MSGSSPSTSSRRRSRKRSDVGDSDSRDDSKLDEALEETFPASDPSAYTVETGIRAGAVPSPTESVRDNHTEHRFELVVNGETAFLLYQRTHDALTLIHTEVPAVLRGGHVGEALVKAAFAVARSAGLRVVAVCPFVRAYLRKHPV